MIVGIIGGGASGMAAALAAAVSPVSSDAQENSVDALSSSARRMASSRLEICIGTVPFRYFIYSVNLLYNRIW